MVNDVKCPKCKSRHFIRKGKSRDKQFQKLRCKNCGKYYSIESFLVNKQIELPEILIAIAEHPDGMFSINKIQINKVRKKEVVQNLEFITKKVPTYQEVVELAAGLENEIHPNTIKLDQIVPKTMRQQLRLLFHPVLAESMEKFMETMCKELPCKK